MSDDAFTRARSRLDGVVEVLLWKTSGLDERALRWPRTPTGVSLLGLLRHCANVELGYLGDSFGRPLPPPEERVLVPMEDFDADPQADWWVPAEIPAHEVTGFARRVHEHVSATLDEGPDLPGRVAWWPPERAQVTLGHVLDYVNADLLRHAGQADVLRELADGAAGISPGGAFVPTEVDWPAYVARLRGIAEGF